MDPDHVINDLEQAAHILLAAPDVVTVNQRREAESVFIAFRKSASPYAVCKHILETSNNYYVAYQAAATLQESLIREWLTLDRSNIESLRVYLMHYVVEKTDLQPYIREQIVQTIAVIHKRYSIDRNPKSKDTDNAIFSDIAQLIHSGTQHAQLVACSILSALLNEYASGSRTSCIGLTWEQHNKCKIMFEQHEMKQVLVFCVCTLAELNKCYDETSVNGNLVALASRILGVIEQVLCWEHATRGHLRKHVGCFNGSQSASFTPPASWRDVVLDKGLIDTFLLTYQKVKRVQDLSHQALMCVAQLASTNGTVFASEASNVDYLNYFVKSFLNVILSNSMEREEVLDVANVLYSIVSYSPLSVIEQVSPDVLDSFLTFLAKSTCDFCRAASSDSENDDTIYAEAFDRLLETWMTFVNKYSELPSDMLKHHATEIMNVYLQCHLAPPGGSRCQVAEDDKEYNEVEEDDKDKFSYQLLTIGSFGRLVPKYSLPLLTMLLNERLTRLEGAAQVLQLCSADANSNQNQRVLDDINEDIHWLLLISASTLADNCEGGETPTMPSSLARSSPSTLTGAFLSHLKSSSTAASGEFTEFQTSEPVVNIMAAILRLCQLQRTFADSSLSCWFSPQVSRSLSHLLTRWSHSYLFLDSSCYSKLASEVDVVFGQPDNDSFRWIVSYLVDYISFNLMANSGEQELVQETLNLFTSLVERKERCDVIVRCDSLWKLAQDFSMGHPHLSALSSQSRRQLCRALVLASAANFDHGCKEAYIQIVFKSMQDRLKAVTSRSDLRSVYYEQSVQSEVLLALDCSSSVAGASRSDNVSLIFEFLYPITIDCVSLIELYHNYEEVVLSVLQLFNVMAKQLMCYLSDKNCRLFYDVLLSMMQTFTKHNVGRQNLSKDTEEDQFASILTLMEILTNLLSKDFIDFAADEPENVNSQTSGTCAADVVLYGLNIIVPLMTAELLKFPALCNAYMALLSYMGEIHADRLCRLPDDLFRRLMSAVEFGLTSDFGSDIAKACLEVVASISSHVCTDQHLTGTVSHMIGAHFLEILFNMLLLNTFDLDLLETASSAFHSLICSHQARYSDLVNQLLTAQSNSPYYPRLLEAFNSLTVPGQQLTIDRASRVRFQQNFDKFLIEVRSFLCVR